VKDAREELNKEMVNERKSVETREKLDWRGNKAARGVRRTVWPEVREERKSCQTGREEAEDDEEEKFPLMLICMEARPGRQTRELEGAGDWRERKRQSREEEEENSAGSEEVGNTNNGVGENAWFVCCANVRRGENNTGITNTRKKKKISWSMDERNMKEEKKEEKGREKRKQEEWDEIKTTAQKRK
jgi:hypothetical protein